MELTKNLGASLPMVGSAFAGNIAGNVVASKIKFFDTLWGRLILLVVGIIVISNAKSEIVKGVGIGVSIAGGQGLIKKFAGSINGIDGIDGLDGVGELIQDANGMLYMTNGVAGELPEYVSGTEEALMGVEAFA